MAEQRRCNLCNLFVGPDGARGVTVGKHLYHATCWLTRMAPSVEAPVYPCGVN